MPRLSVRGIEFHFEDCGGGPPLLCIPGALGSGATDFGPHLEGFSRHFRVIAPDPRGYGQSRPPERDFPRDFFERDAHDMAALMSACGCEVFNVAGWSDGANVAMLLAALYPSRVRKLAIWGGNSYISAEDDDRLQRIRLVHNWSRRIREPLEATYGDRLQELWSRYCDGLHDLYLAGGEICRDKLHLIRCPTLILHGALDPLVPEFHPRLLAQRIAKSSLKTFPDGGHNFHLLLADEFSAAVKTFLQ
ncbi:MAG: alpha/beta hydrolase [Bryobacterales bacterium]|nr:alpha/beta hydrolase [Bryobacterales bacterium]MBV9396401.1 alpha/beta hydrolase [Bryobacterales bacterium]